MKEKMLRSVLKSLAVQIKSKSKKDPDLLKVQIDGFNSLLARVDEKNISDDQLKVLRQEVNRLLAHCQLG